MFQAYRTLPIAASSLSREELDPAAAAAGPDVLASVGVSLVDTSHRVASVGVVPVRQQQVRRRHARPEPARAQRVHRGRKWKLRLHQEQ